MGDTVLDVDGSRRLAALPSLDELRAKIVGLIQAPATKIARTIAEPGAPARPSLRRLRGQGSRLSTFFISTTKRGLAPHKEYEHG